MSFTSGNDINILQGTDLATVGAGAGNDRYVLDASTLNPNQRITISDIQGQNTLQLTGGLVIMRSLVSGDALQLTLINGAVVTVLGANNFRFQTGGNPINGTGGTVQTYADFSAALAGSSGIPAAGAAPVLGGPKTVADAGGARNLTTPTIQFNLLNEAQYDAAYSQGLRGDALQPLAGVYLSKFQFLLNDQRIDLTQQLNVLEGPTNDSVKTYAQAVTAINTALNVFKTLPQNTNNLALQTVQAKLGNKFSSDISTLTDVGLREGTSILLTVDPIIGTGVNTYGTNQLRGDISGLQLEMINSGFNTFPNGNRYERVFNVETDYVQSTLAAPLQLTGVIALPELL